ncbi:MAG: hypothetical protein QOG87_4266 [Actinomycetota bacterium]|jgi:hypothetical protein
MARSATGPRPFLAAAAGVAVGAVVVVALAVAGWPPADDDAPTEPPAVSTAAASRFLAAWERSLRGTWVVDARFVRVTAAGGRLTLEVHTAQRPPDRLSAGQGRVEARLGGRRLGCTAGEDGVLACKEEGGARPYDEEVAEDMRTLATYVRGPGAFYAVGDEGDCFRLRLRLRVLSPPYGERARFCFDRATGAPVRSEIEKREGVDRTVAISVRAQPTDDDLDPERWRAEQPR